MKGQDVSPTAQDTTHKRDETETHGTEEQDKRADARPRQEGACLRLKITEHKRMSETF